MAAGVLGITLYTDEGAVAVARVRVLVVDDEREIQRYIRSNLSARGYTVQVAGSGPEGLAAAERGQLDLVILDLMMPGLDGFAMLGRLREWSQLPVIVLSARDSSADKIRALDLGADDYLTKPFSIDELLAHLRAVLRRTQHVGERLRQSATFRCGELEVDYERELVTVAGQPVHLTRTEYSLLRELTSNAGKLLTHSVLLGHVWGPEYLDEPDYLPAFIRRLRRKIEIDPKNPRYILTEHRAGYRFAPPESPQERL